MFLTLAEHKLAADAADRRLKQIEVADHRKKRTKVS